MAERVKELRSGLHAVFRRLDKPMFLLVLAALCFGFVIQYSEMSAGFITRRSMATQLIAGGIGAVAMLLTAELDYRQLAAGWRFHLPVTLGLTLLTFTSLAGCLTGRKVRTTAHGSGWESFHFSRENC